MSGIEVVMLDMDAARNECKEFAAALMEIHLSTNPGVTVDVRNANKVQRDKLHERLVASKFSPINRGINVPGVDYLHITTDGYHAYTTEEIRAIDADIGLPAPSDAFIAYAALKMFLTVFASDINSPVFTELKAAAKAKFIGPDGVINPQVVAAATAEAVSEKDCEGGAHLRIDAMGLPGREERRFTADICIACAHKAIAGDAEKIAMFSDPDLVRVMLACLIDTYGPNARR